MQWKMSFVASALGLVLFPLWTRAQEQNAFCIPRSDRVISGELVLPNKSGKGREDKVRFVVRDGTWVTVEDSKAGYFFAFNGIINDKTGNPNFVPYQLTRTSPNTTMV